MVALALLSFAAARAQATSYVFATFTGDALAQEKLSTYESTDALNFKLVSNTGFAGPSGALRDPSIMKYADGKYYVAYTDPMGAGCCGKEDHFSIATSTDLVSWSNKTLVMGGVPGVAHVWAPEWFVEGSTVSIIANIDTLNTDSDFKPYIFTALDATLSTWSGPVALGIGPNYIDTFVLKVDGTYHAFVKNESTRYLEHATASNLTGPWTFIGKGDWAGWGSGMEGPSLVQLDDGTWRMLMDPQQSGFFYASSPDLMSWSKTAPLPGLTNVVRHGTVIRDVAVGSAGSSSGGNGGAGGVANLAGAGGLGGSSNVGGAGGSTTLGGASGSTTLGGAGGSTTLGGAGGVAGLLEAGGTSSGGAPGTSGGSSVGGSVVATSSAGAAAAAGSSATSPQASAETAGCSCRLSRPEPALGRLWLGAVLAGLAQRLRRRRRHGDAR